MTITFIGHGYVGLVTAAVFADLGNTVYVIGHTKEKIEKFVPSDVLEKIRTVNEIIVLTTKLKEAHL